MGPRTRSLLRSFRPVSRFQLRLVGKIPLGSNRHSGFLYTAHKLPQHATKEAFDHFGVLRQWENPNNKRRAASCKRRRFLNRLLVVFVFDDSTSIHGIMASPGEDAGEDPPGLDTYNSDSDSDSSYSSSDEDRFLPRERRKRNLKKAVVAAAALAVALTKFPLARRHREKRREQFRRRRQRHRRKAEDLLKESVDDGLFAREFRMSHDSFRKLVNLLRDDLVPKNIKRSRTDYIDPTSKVMMTLRWLAGGSYIDQCRIHGVSVSVFFKCTKQVVRAICKHPEIGYAKWPETLEECEAYASEWAELSGPFATRGLFTTVVGMLDGILIGTLSPSKKEATNQDDYRSGHKKRIGLNCQAMCDAKLRFIFVSVLCPGKTHDLTAYEHSRLSKLVESLPEGYFCGGDNAYVNSEHLIVPLPGRALSEEDDAFNFYFSQLRIRIECAFGLLVARWGILWRPLRGKLKNWPSIISAVCKLHNYCIDEKEGQPMSTGPGGSTIPARAAIMEDPRYGERVLADRSEWVTNYQFQRRVDGPNLRRQLVQRVADRGFLRPHSNLVRNMLREGNSS